MFISLYLCPVLPKDLPCDFLLEAVLTGVLFVLTGFLDVLQAVCLSLFATVLAAVLTGVL